MSSSTAFSLSQQNNTVIFKFQPCSSFDPLDHQKEIAEQLAAEPYRSCQNILVDCSEVTYANSMFLEWLLHLASIVRDRDGKFGIAAVGSFLKDLMHVTKLDERWTIYDDVDQGLKGMS